MTALLYPALSLATPAPAAPPPSRVIIQHLPPQRGQPPMVRLVDPRSGSGPAMPLRRAAIYLQARGFAYLPGSNGHWQIT